MSFLGFILFLSSPLRDTSWDHCYSSYHSSLINILFCSLQLPETILAYVPINVYFIKYYNFLFFHLFHLSAVLVSLEHSLLTDSLFIYQYLWVRLQEQRKSIVNNFHNIEYHHKIGHIAVQQILCICGLESPVARIIVFFT